MPSSGVRCARLLNRNERKARRRQITRLDRSGNHHFGLFAKSCYTSRRVRTRAVRTSSPLTNTRTRPRLRSAGPARFYCGRLSRRRFHFVEAWDGHLVEPSVYFLRGDQVSHRRLKRFVSHPVLYGADIEARPERARRERRSERLQIEFGRVEPGACRNRLAVVKHVVFPIPFR